MSSLQTRIDNISKDVSSNTAISSIVPGTKIYQLIESLANQNIDLEKQIDNFAVTESITQAEGQALDKIGQNTFGIYRQMANPSFTTESMKAIKFYVKIGSFGDINRDGNNQAKDIIVPEGTLIEGSYGGLYYKMRTTKEYVLGSNESECYIATELVQGDYSTIPSNILTYHNFTGYSQGRSNLLLVTNPVGISTGRQVEDDEAYRYRISRAIKIFPKTTYYGIYDTVITTPGVADVNILSGSNGGGTLMVYVQGSTPITSDEVISDVKLKLENSIPPWATFNVVKPFCVGLVIEVSIQVLEFSEFVRSTVVDKVSEYVNNFYGDKFYVNRILHVINAAHGSINNVSFDKITTYVGSTEFREATNQIDYSDINNPVIYLRAIDKLIIEPIPNAIIVNFVI